MGSIIQAVDDNGNGSLDFQEFLQILRKIYNRHNEQRIAKEKRMVEETQFTPHEVHEFRQLFLSMDDDDNGELSLNEFKQMITVICPMGDKNSSALNNIFYEMSKQQRGVEGSREELDFP